MPRSLLSLFFVRHGLSQANMDKSVNSRLPDQAVPLAGSPDSDDLHENGHAQAYEAGRRFVSHILERDGRQTRRLRLLVSPYLRTRQTSEGFERALREAGFVYDRREVMELREISFGLYDGLSTDALKREFPREDAHYQKYVDHRGELFAPMPLGESRIQVGDRVVNVFGTIKRDAEPRARPNGDGPWDPLREGPVHDFVMISHGVTIRQARHRWMHYPWEWVEKEPNPGNCSIQVIENLDGNGYVDHTLFEGFHHVRGHEKQERLENGGVDPVEEPRHPDAQPTAHTDDDAIQAELESFTFDKGMSPGLRARFVEEADPERLDDDMREGRNDAGLWVAWLRS